MRWMVFILTGLRGTSRGLLYCILWLLVTSHHQKGEHSNAPTSEAQILALEHLTLQGEHQLSVSCVGLMTHNWTVTTASRKAVMHSVQVTKLLWPEWKWLRWWLSSSTPRGNCEWCQQSFLTVSVLASRGNTEVWEWWQRWKMAFRNGAWEWHNHSC